MITSTSTHTARQTRLTLLWALNSLVWVSVTFASQRVWTFERSGLILTHGMTLGVPFRRMDIKLLRTTRWFRTLSRLSAVTLPRVLTRTSRSSIRLGPGVSRGLNTTRQSAFYVDGSKAGAFLNHSMTDDTEYPVSSS